MTKTTKQKTEKSTNAALYILLLVNKTKQKLKIKTNLGNTKNFVQPTVIKSWQKTKKKKKK